jgi:hypothetical protein
MDIAVLEPVLKELLQQQQEILAEREKESESREMLFLKLEAFDKKLDTLKSMLTNELSAAFMPIKKGIDEVKWLMEAQPKTVVHEKRFQLFPNKPEEYYKLIFGNLFKGLVILILGIYTLVIINRYLREREYLHYKQAWQYLYNMQNEEQKQYLEKVMKDCENENLSVETKVSSRAKKAESKNTTTERK